MNEAWTPFAQLREAIAAAVEPLGVEFQDWMIHEQHQSISVILRVKDDAFRTPEERKDQKILDDMAAYEAQRAAEEKAEQAREGLQNLLQTRRATDGIFDTPDE